MADPRVVIGLSFGSRPREGPDPVNEGLAALCDRVAAMHDIPILAQWEIGTRTKRIPQLIVDRDGKQHLDTRQVLVQAWEWCQTRDIRDIALVAGAFHAPRARAAAQRIGFNVVLVNTRHATWDRKSTQWWTHGPLVNVLRELPACGYYLIRGWL